MSPLDFEFEWKKKEQQIASYFGQNKFSMLFFFLVFLCFAIASQSLWTASNYPLWANLFIVQDRYWASLILISLAFVAFPISKKYYPYFLFFSLAASWLLPIYFLHSLRWASIFPILYIGFNGLLNQRLPKHHLLTFFINLVTFFGVLLGLAADSIQSHDAKMLQYYSILHTEFLFLFFLQLNFQRNKNLSFCFSPTHLYAPFPIPEESTSESTRPWSTEKNEKKMLFVRGTLQILQSQLIFVVLFWIAKSNLLPSTENSFLHYYFFLFLIVGAMKVVTGLLWLYGFKTPSASYFLFLAKSPLETWQRGSVFIAKFIFSSIYLPLWKIFRNSFFASAVVVTFIAFHLFLFHEWVQRSILSSIFPALPLPSQNMEALTQKCLWLCLWVLWIVFFQIFILTRPFFNTKSIGPWLLILLTQAGNMSIIPLTSWLSKILFS